MSRPNIIHAKLAVQPLTPQTQTRPNRLHTHTHPPKRLAHPRSPIPPLSTLTSRARHAHSTSPRSTGFCAIWGCISSSSISQRSSAFRNRSSPTHAFGILSALVSFLISIFVRAVRARPPSSRCRHHRHQRCHQHPTVLIILICLYRHCSSGEFPRNLCTACSHLDSVTTAALSPCLRPCLVLLPPPQLCTQPPPAHLRERMHPTPLPLPQTMH